jgi:hypothetical protein
MQKLIFFSTAIRHSFTNQLFINAERHPYLHGTMGRASEKSHTASIKKLAKDARKSRLVHDQSPG